LTDPLGRESDSQNTSPRVSLKHDLIAAFPKLSSVKQQLLFGTTLAGLA
jgi:hypothetical protein